MATPISTVTPYAGQTPAKEQEDTVFDANIDDELAYINVLPVQLNTTIGELNTFGGEMETIAASAETDAAIATAQADLAEEWATSATIVEATDYSAKEYAIGTTVESAKRHASGTVATGSAKDWASSTTEVTDGLKGARGYAQDSQTILSDVQSIAASIPVGQIDNGDDFSVDTNAWSNIRTAFETNSLPWKPIVNLDFARDNYETYVGLSAGTTRAPLLDLVTFSRASSGTGVNAFGNVETVAANQPRIVFENGVAKGILLENTSENLLTWSEDFSDSSWLKALNTTVNPDAIIAPDGTLSADIFTKTASAYQYVYKGFTADIGDYVLSVRVKRIDLDDFIIMISGDGGTTANARVGFNFTTKLFTNYSSTSLLSTDYVELRDDWVELRVSTYMSVNSNPRVLLYAGVYSATLPGSVAVWGAQLEQSSTPSSYIKTEGTSVVRAADDFSYTLPVGFDGSSGTIFLDVKDVVSDPVSDFGRIFQLDDGTSNNMIYAIRRIAGRYSFYIRANGVDQLPFTSVVISDSLKILIKWENNSSASVYANGALISSSSNITSPELSVLRLGRSYSEGLIFSQKLSKVCIFPEALPDVVCQAITGV